MDTNIWFRGFSSEGASFVRAKRYGAGGTREGENKLQFPSRHVPLASLFSRRPPSFPPSGEVCCRGLRPPRGMPWQGSDAGENPERQNSITVCFTPLPVAPFPSSPPSQPFLFLRSLASLLNEERNTVGSRSQMAPPKWLLVVALLACCLFVCSAPDDSRSLRKMQATSRVPPRISYLLAFSG